MPNDPVPVLSTARLRLRPHRTDDFPAMCALWSDPTVVRYISGRPSTPQETWARLLRHAGHWSMLGYGYWVVEDVAEGRFLGEVGFGEFRRDLVPPVEGLPEAGWVLSSEAAGRGIATEAMGAALTWLDNRTDFRKCFCILDPAHAASRRVARKLGFASEVEGTCGGEMATLLFRDRPSGEAGSGDLGP